MIIVYSIIVVSLIILFLISKSYKKERIKDISSKKEPLKTFFPLGMFLEDRVLWKIKIFNSEKVDKNLKALLVKEKIETEKYLYKIKKITICILVFFILNLFGFLICIQMIVSDEGNVEKIIRPFYGEGAKDYELKINDEKETLSVKVEEKQYTPEEILKIFDDSFEKVIKEFLGDNQSQDEIMYPLNLIYNYEDFNISWQFSDTELIDYSGNINNIELEEAVISYLTVEFSMEDVTKEYEIALRVIPYVENQDKTLEEKVQESIDKNNDVYDNTVILPDIVDGSSISFSMPKESVGLKFLVAGLLLAIAVFILYDRDLENKIKKRENQMLGDYSDIVSKLTLLMGAGMTISLAWERIVKDYERKTVKGKKRFAFEEMKLANTKIKSGVSENIAYREFGKRCSLQPYLKLAGLLEQNLIKGNKELKILLEGEVREAFENRKNLAKIKGEEAGTKLLFPMVIMLGIVIIIIVVPAFMSMNF